MGEKNVGQSERATATAATAAAAALLPPLLLPLLRLPGEAILARTDATGAGAGVEGAYEAEMMEALAACGD